MENQNIHYSALMKKISQQIWAVLGGATQQAVSKTDATPMVWLGTRLRRAVLPADYLDGRYYLRQRQHNARLLANMKRFFLEARQRFKANPHLLQPPVPGRRGRPKGTCPVALAHALQVPYQAGWTVENVFWAWCAQQFRVLLEALKGTSKVRWHHLCHQLDVLWLPRWVSKGSPPHGFTRPWEPLK